MEKNNSIGDVVAAAIPNISTTQKAVPESALSHDRLRVVNAIGRPDPFRMFLLVLRARQFRGESDCIRPYIVRIAASSRDY